MSATVGSRSTRRTASSQVDRVASSNGAPGAGDARRRRASCAAACRAARQRHVDRACRRSSGSSTQQPCRRRSRRPTHRERAALARAQIAANAASRSGAIAEHVALLRLVAPDLQRRHAGLVAGDVAQVEARAAVGCRGRARAARSTGRRRRRRGSRRSGCRRRAPSSDRSPPGSGAPSRRCRAAPTRNRDPPRDAPDAERRRRAAAEADQHRRARRARRARRPPGSRSSATCSRADVAEAAGDHDRLVVAADARGRRDRRPPARTCGSSRRGRAAELVVERGAAERAVDHDVERAGDARRACRASISHGRAAPGRRRFETEKPARPALGLRAAAGRALVADLAARAGGRARGTARSRSGGCASRP